MLDPDHPITPFFDDDADRNQQRGLHDHRRQAVRQHVADQDRDITGALRLARPHVVRRGLEQRAAVGDARQRRHVE